MITYFYYNNCNYLCYNEFMKNKKDFIDLVQKKISELTNVPELLIVSKNEALANAFGMRVDQETTAATLMLENESFAETSTHSQFVNAVSRSYDMHKGEIKVYRGKHFGELRFKAPANMTYDQYIEKVGKLPRQKYFATQLRVRPKDIIHETSSQISQKYPEELKIGDFVVVRESEKDIIREIADKLLESIVVFLAIAEASVDEAHQLNLPSKAQLFVAGTEDILIKDIFDALFLQA